MRRLKMVLAAVVWLAMLYPAMPAKANANGDALIRVALFIEGRGTVPAVTLSAPQGLAVGEPNQAPWFIVDGDRPLRFSLHEYRIKSAAISDEKTAIDTAHSMRAVTGNADVFVTQTGSNLMYTVYAGRYADAASAREALARVPGAAAVAGPHHWEVGVFNDVERANALKNEMIASGLHAAIAIRSDANGDPQYAVWVGEAADAAERDALRARIMDVQPDLTIAEANVEQPFLYERTEWDDHERRGVLHYSISASGHSLQVAPRHGNIRVDERSSRTYRGHIELQAWRGRMAVINELPLESYLYSVVSAEMGGGWPLEALKAQAVAARTYALKQGMKYEIAHVSDTTFDQAYYGAGHEAEDAVRAVDETRGETIRDRNGELIEPFYSANAGGMTASASEVWNEDLPYIRSVPSPDDLPEKSRLDWAKVALADGTIAYVRTDFVRETGETNAVGFPVLEATANNVNVRAAPYVDNVGNPPLAQISAGDRLILLERRIESNPYRWVRGPFSAADMERVIRERTGTDLIGPLETLEVTERGPSGRVVEMRANGSVIQVSNADAYRTVMNGLPSTRFEVEQTGAYTILAANNRRFDRTSGPVPYVIAADGAVQRGSERMIALSLDGDVRVVTGEAAFRFIGMGYGHGVGMSQWGARELAEFMQYDYKQILEYYYYGVTIAKEG